MISTNGLYHKSPKGAEAIATRQHGLAPRLRSLLILIDGKRGPDELARLSGAADAASLLEQLLEQGFIEPAAAAMEPVPQPVPAGPSSGFGVSGLPSGFGVSGPPGTVSLKEAQRFAVRRLTDLMGPTAEQLCLRIESAKTAQEFMQAAARALEVVRQFGGEQMAMQLRADIQAHRPLS